MQHKLDSCKCKEGLQKSPQSFTSGCLLDQPIAIYCSSLPHTPFIASIGDIKWRSFDPQCPSITSTTRFYNPGAFHLEVRAELVDWVRQLNSKLGYTLKTFHLAVYIMDGLLSVYEVPVNCIKLVTYLSLYLAAKFEESTEKVKSLDSVTNLFGGEFSFEKIRQTEITILSIFGYGLNRRTFYLEIEELLSRGIVICHEVYSEPRSGATKRLLQDLRDQFNAIEELISLCYEINAFHPRIVAAAAVLLARRSLGLLSWPEWLHRLTGLEMDDLVECVKLLELNGISNVDTDRSIEANFASKTPSLCQNSTLDAIDSAIDEPVLNENSNLL